MPDSFQFRNLSTYFRCSEMKAAILGAECYFSLDDHYDVCAASTRRNFIMDEDIDTLLENKKVVTATTFLLQCISKQKLLLLCNSNPCSANKIDLAVCPSFNLDRKTIS